MEEKEKNIEKTLKLLDEKILPEFDYFFSTRLNAKLEEESRNEKSGFKEILKPALIFILLLLNIFTLIYGLSSSSNINTYNRKDLIDIITDEVFYSSENSIY